MNGAGTGMVHTAVMSLTLAALRRATNVSGAAVAGATPAMTVLFLTGANTSRTTAAMTTVSVSFAPLSKYKLCRTVTLNIVML